MSDDLVERVAIAIDNAICDGDQSSVAMELTSEEIKVLSRAAIAVALEEAARVVDSMAEDLAREFEPSPSIAWVREKAAAIRAMIPQEPA